jgi:citrate lyase subunit beta/citryl-CoA lyase
MTWRPRRSVLFTPAGRADRWHKTLKAGKADVAVIDLEDAVPMAEKENARKAVARALKDAPDSRTERALRINTWPSALAAADLAAITPGSVDLILVPKAERAEDVKDLDAALSARGDDARLMLIVETARGVLHADRFPPASDRVVALAFGAEDYAATVGARRTHRATEVLWARSRTVAAAAAYDVQAIDQVYVDYKDAEGFLEECRFAAQLGYEGKMLIHPDQVAIAHGAFAPTEAQMAQAQRIIEAVTAAGGDVGVVIVDGRMIDGPLIAQARRIMRWAELDP